MKHWPTKPLLEICKPKQWPTISTAELTETGFPVYGANGQIGLYRSYNHEEPTILITCRGATCGTLNISPPKTYVTGNAMALDDLNLEIIHFRFLYYALLGRGLQDTITGAAQPQITRTNLRRISIPVPSLAEQERIVKLLDEADDLRKLRAQADRYTSTLIPALFHEMFGDPVANEKNWPRHKLTELCENKKGIKAGPFGSSLKKDCYTSEGPRVYGQEQVIAGDFSIGDYHISEAKFAEMTAYMVKSGDLLITLVGTIGKVVVVPNGIERGIINPRLLRVRPRPGLLHPCYLVHVLTSSSTIQFLENIATGITMGVLNAGLLKQLDVPLPPLVLQKQFAARVTEIREMESVQSASRRRLDDLFQSMLHRAFEGEL